MSRGDVIIALDFPSAEAVYAFLDKFENEARKPYVKVGMELFYAEGPQIVREIKARGHKIFLDLKLHDIPNTVKKAMASLSRLDVDMTNLHAAGTIDMMKAALEGLTRPDGTRPMLLAVTQLTSTSEERMRRELLINASMPDTVKKYAQNAKEAGLDGVVCSPLEAALVKEACGAAFQTVTLRTAGFNTIDQSALTDPSQAVACVLMLIGGSPGSTAGGLKTVTVAVLALSAVSALRGRTSVTAFGRTIEPRSIMNAVALTVVGVTIILGGACAISFIENVPMNLCLFETASAFGTVGLTMSLTPALSAVSHIMLIVMMYFGRVGVLTFGVAVFLRRREPPKLTFPSGNVMIG